MAEEKEYIDPNDVLNEAIANALYEASQYEIGSEERKASVNESKILMGMKNEWNRTEYDYEVRMREAELKEAELAEAARKNDIYEAQIKAEILKAKQDTTIQYIKLGLLVLTDVALPIAFKIVGIKFIDDQTIKRMIYEASLSWRTTLGKDISRKYENFEQELLSYH